MCVCARVRARVHALTCVRLCDPMDCSPPGSSVHGNFVKNTGVGSHFLLQGIFPLRDPTQISCISWTGRWNPYQWPTWEVHTPFFKAMTPVQFMKIFQHGLFSPVNIPPSGGQIGTVHLAHGAFFLFPLSRFLCLVPKTTGLCLFYHTISPFHQS